MNINKLVKVLIIGLVSTQFCLSNVYAAQQLDKVVAVVNGDIISQSELDSYTKLVLAEMQQAPGTTLPAKNVLQEQVLNRMIMDRIQIQLAAQVGIEVDSLTVSQALQSIAKDHGQTIEALKNSVEARGIKFHEYRDLIKTEITIQNLQGKEVHQEITVAKAEIESYLNSPAGQDNSGTEYRISHILLLTPDAPTPDQLKKVQQDAEQLVSQIKNGADFAKLAMTKSAGSQALKGGDLGWRSSGELPTLFVPYMSSLKVGETSGPIRSSSGFHIIRLQEKRVTTPAQLSETHVRQILIKTDNSTSSKEAQQKLAVMKLQLKKSADFAKLAIQKSQDQRSADKGGDIGWVDEKTVTPEFYAVMSKLRNNEISDPFETEDGWLLIQVINRRMQSASNEAAINKAREILGIRKANEALESWMKRIRDEARVEIMLQAEPAAKQV